MKVRHGSKRRRALMWSLTITSTLSLALWLVSLRWDVGLESVACFYFGVCRGAVAVDLDHDATDLGYLAEGVGTARFYMERRRMPLIWSVRYANRRPPGFTTGWWECALALWPVVLMTGIPGAWLWATRPRRGPGDCPACGYDRRGIDGGRPCPECGQFLALAG